MICHHHSAGIFSPTVIAVIACLSIPLGSVAADPARGREAHVEIIRQEQQLELRIENARLDEIVKALGNLFGFETVVVGDYATSSPITSTMKMGNSESAVEQLLTRANTMIIYDAPATNPTRRLKQVWLLEAVDGFQMNADASVSHRDQMPSDTERYYTDMNSTDLKTRSEAALRLARQVDAENKNLQSKDWALAELIQSLLHDPDALVRTRAATALGRAQDARAVTALRSATYDTHFSVRAQGIGALGDIGGAEATAILGGILTASGEFNDTERSIAGQALWKLNSKAALYYLKASPENHGTAPGTSIANASRNAID